MRSRNTDNWETLLEQATHNSNYSHHKTLGNLSPIDLNSRTKAVNLDLQRGLQPETSFREFRTNQKEYEKRGKIQVNDFCYLAVPSTNPPKAGAFQVYPTGSGLFIFK